MYPRSSVEYVIELAYYAEHATSDLGLTEVTGASAAPVGARPHRNVGVSNRDDNMITYNSRRLTVDG